MKIRTIYRHGENDCEIIDPTRVTDGSQYKSISECVQMVARGEAINLHDYTKDSPVDTAEFFDIADNVERINRNAENIKKKYQKKDAEPPKDDIKLDESPTQSAE